MTIRQRLYSESCGFHVGAQADFLSEIWVIFWRESGEFPAEFQAYFLFSFTRIFC
jgi:hypothetical protein